jgi:hypothetical protein
MNRRVALRLSLRLGGVRLLLEGFAFQRRQFGTVADQLLNQGPL